MSRQSVDLHPSGPDDQSVRVQMERMELSSGEVVDQRAAMSQSPADEAMDQCTCMICTVYIHTYIYNVHSSQTQGLNLRCGRLLGGKQDMLRPSKYR